MWPKPEGETYIANVDIGIVMGQFKTKKFNGPSGEFEVEFDGQLIDLISSIKVGDEASRARDLLARFRSTSSRSSRSPRARKAVRAAGRPLECLRHLGRTW